MSIRAVFRVQCDGPGKEWLSLPEGYVPGTDIRSEQLVAAPTAERAGNWPGERAARTAAKRAGWRYVSTKMDNREDSLMCPVCAANPLAIDLPPNDRNEGRGEY